MVSVARELAALLLATVKIISLTSIINPKLLDGEGRILAKSSTSMIKQPLSILHGK